MQTIPITTARTKKQSPFQESYPPKSRIIRLPEVKHRTGLSRSSIYARIKDGSFPAQVSLGGRGVGWLESSVDGFIEGCGPAREAR